MQREMQRDREQVQHSMEIGAEMTRTTMDAVTRIGHQAIDAYRQVAALQADATDRWIEQSVRISRLFYGDGGDQARDALASWNHVWERGLRRSFEATRALAESMLKAQSEMIEATMQALAARDRAMTENLEQLQRTAETATSQTALAGSRAAQQASSQPKKAA